MQITYLLICIITLLIYRYNNDHLQTVSQDFKKYLNFNDCVTVKFLVKNLSYMFLIKFDDFYVNLLICQTFIILFFSKL